eukprot:jgi/Chlat1/4850/Chrsp31S04810
MPPTATPPPPPPPHHSHPPHTLYRTNFQADISGSLPSSVTNFPATYLEERLLIPPSSALPSVLGGFVGGVAEWLVGGGGGGGRSEEGGREGQRRVRLGRKLLHMAYANALGRAQEELERRFGARPGHGPIVAAAAPGRVNLIGEHTDYNDGWVLPLALEKYTVVVGRARSDPSNVECEVHSVDLDQTATFRADKTLAPGEPSWCDYIKGVVAQFIKDGRSVPGFCAVIASDVPMGGGLSSSASVEVATSTFLEQLPNVGPVDNRTKALWCQTAEHEFPRVPCGIMDQFISVMGQHGHALLIDCRTLETRLVRMNDPGIALVVANTGVKHSLAGGEYAKRRKQCETAVHAIKNKHPEIQALRDCTMQMLEEAAPSLEEVVVRRARHVIEEDQRTLQCVEALNQARDGDYVMAGQLMVQSHESLRVNYEVSCSELDTMVDIVKQVEGVFGTRMTGGGFGGCTITLCAQSAVSRVVKAVENDYHARTGCQPLCFVTRPGDGAIRLPL